MTLADFKNTNAEVRQYAIISERRQIGAIIEGIEMKCP